MYGNCTYYNNNNGIFGNCHTKYTNISAPFVNKYNSICINTVTYFFDMHFVNEPFPFSPLRLLVGIIWIFSYINIIRFYSQWLSNQ